MSRWHFYVNFRINLSISVKKKLVELCQFLFDNSRLFGTLSYTFRWSEWSEGDSEYLSVNITPSPQQLPCTISEIMDSRFRRSKMFRETNYVLILNIISPLCLTVLASLNSRKTWVLACALHKWLDGFWQVTFFSSSTGCICSWILRQGSGP